MSGRYLKQLLYLLKMLLLVTIRCHVKIYCFKEKVVCYVELNIEAFTSLDYFEEIHSTKVICEIVLNHW